MKEGLRSRTADNMPTPVWSGPDSGHDGIKGGRRNFANFRRRVRQNVISVALEVVARGGLALLRPALGSPRWRDAMTDVTWTAAMVEERLIPLFRGRSPMI